MIKDEILNFIISRKFVSFAELSNHIKGFNGEWTYHAPGMENIILWTEMSEEACNALTELLESKQIVAEAAATLVYLADGAGLTLPIVKRAQNYKKPHWLPVIFNPATNPQPAKEKSALTKQ